MSDHPTRARAAALVAACALALPALAQKPLDKSKPRWDPANDPYTRGGQPELLEAAGYVSMGGFEFGPAPDTTAEVNEFLPYLDLRWIETEHFEIGVALPKVKVTGDERDKIRAELERLVEVFPDVNPKTRVLDPWLRAHLYAMRLEDHYEDVQEFLGVTDETFADNKALWIPGTPYRGIGPYLGQLGKFEVLLLPSEGAAKDYLRAKLGLTTKLTQRWNVIERESTSLIVHTDQGRLDVDEALHGHVVFNVTYLLLNGYEHYSYDKPIWACEGTAHWFERKINPRFNTFNSSEGSTAEMIRKSDWEDPTLKLVRSGDAPSFASLVNMRTFAELKREHHYATWSIVDFLTRAHPEFLPAYFARISGLKNEENIDDGRELPEAQRAAFKDLLGMTYGQFDRAWRAWVEENY
ncbi:MAG: hypothetical protein AAF726_18940 [Planctomycetota bacterium]